MKVFLSYASKDRNDVRRLGADLHAAGLDVWLDEWRIQVGDSITEKVEEGIEAADYVAVWLTKHAVASRWVDKEWRTKFRAEIDSGQVLVLPLLAEECSLPPFLQDKRYADFRASYDAGLRELLARFELPSPQLQSRASGTEILAEILVLLDAAQWILDLLNLVRPFYGDASSLEKRKRLNIAKDISKRVAVKIARFNAEHKMTSELCINAILEALNRLIRITEPLLPQLGERRSGNKEVDGSEWFHASDALCAQLPRSGSTSTPASRFLDSDAALNAEFVAIREDDLRLYGLIGFESREAYEQHVNPSVSTLVSNGQPEILAVLRQLINIERTTDLALLEMGYEWLSIETVFNALLKEKMAACDYREPLTMSITRWEGSTFKAAE